MSDQALSDTVAQLMARMDVMQTELTGLRAQAVS